MYAIIESKRLFISVAESYDLAWYDKHWPLAGKEKFAFDYGHLEIDVHKGGRRYLTGFAIDPRAFIADYLKTRYRKIFPVPRKIVSVSIDSGKHVELFTVEFTKGRSFVVDGLDKDLIFPQFVGRRGQLKIHGFEVLDVSSVLKYLVKRFKYKAAPRIRKGYTVYDLKTGRRWGIGRRKKR